MSRFFTFDGPPNQSKMISTGSSEGTEEQNNHIHVYLEASLTEFNSICGCSIAVSMHEIRIHIIIFSMDWNTFILLR